MFITEAREGGERVEDQDMIRKQLIRNLVIIAVVAVAAFLLARFFSPF